VLEYRLATFTGYVGTDFQVLEDEAIACTLRLVEIMEHTRTPKLETFSLFFVGPPDVFLGQGTRNFKHDELGAFELFLVPVGKVEAGFRYEAVFNLLLQS
jgi:hypothetical protein